MNIIIFEGILFIVLILASIIFHEMGHLFLINRYSGKKHKLEFNRNTRDLECDINGLNLVQIFYVTLVGVISGFTLISLFVNYISGYTYLALITLYFSGCRHDLKTLYDINKELKEDERR